MTTLVIHASIAIKWVVQESGTADALQLRSTAKLVAPDLLAAECANVLWKKIQRNELSMDEALLAARLIERADVELLATRALIESATRIAVALNQPAYDCLYLALAKLKECHFVTADERFVRKARESDVDALRDTVLSLPEAAQGLR